MRYHTKLYHLCYGNTVFKNIGYTENDSLITFLVSLNYEIYKVEGYIKNFAKVKFNPENPKKYTVSILHEGPLILDDLVAPIGIILKSFEEFASYG